MSFDFNEIRQLLVTIANTDIAELILKGDDFEITVRKTVTSHHPQQSISQSPLTSVVGSGIPVSPGTSIPTSDTGNGLDADKVSNGANQPSSASSNNAKLVEVPSPMVGTFYRAPAPGESAFVEVGDRVRSDQTVCIIEAMKLMNEIEAEVSGQVMEILVENGEAVEYGQPLMRINPD
ncbi:acetyl-CoA carboxylase biotin carboxyl carrier protein [Calothrix rhizosoleniae]|uniref:acetyl-CoA carboxylase biotin carboxyl carrier protein n=1 Tax=Calothrix rhizosoleniae TaxID=888997 RepID=UPI000B49732A|nr:acetyl-CoA carboxylase biotin carboxyl carrier protein [Calothrix rhizosoleniae]